MLRDVLRHDIGDCDDHHSDCDYDHADCHDDHSDFSC